MTMTSNHGVASMFEKWNKQREQMTPRASDDRIVPMELKDQLSGSKPGNAGEGKAVGISHICHRALSVLRDGTAVSLWCICNTQIASEDNIFHPFRCSQCNPACEATGRFRKVPLEAECRVKSGSRMLESGTSGSERGMGFNCPWLKYCGTTGKPGGKQRKQSLT